MGSSIDARTDLAKCVPALRRPAGTDQDVAIAHYRRSAVTDTEWVPGSLASARSARDKCELMHTSGVVGRNAELVSGTSR